MRVIICTSLALLSASTLVESQRARFGPGVCGPLDRTYVSLATGTGGQPYPMSPEEIAKSPGPMNSFLFKEMILWASGDREHSYLIPVDSTMTGMMLSGTFDGTGGAVTVTAPDGRVVQQDSAGIADNSLNCGRIMVVDKPATGSWQVRVAPTNRFWLTAHTRSDLSLMEAEFVEPAAGLAAGRLVSIQGQPIAGRGATLRVSLAPGIQNPTFHLISLAAQPIRAVGLESADSGEFIGVLEPPAEPFRVMVIGRDESGLRVQRIRAGQFHGEPIEIVPPEGETVTAGAAVPVTFTIKNHGPAVHLKLIAVDHGGRVMPVDPSALDLAAGAEGAATVRLLVPIDSAPLSEASIHLTASSDNDAVGGFNSAQKTYTIVFPR
jgi:hypothetical protein